MHTTCLLSGNKDVPFFVIITAAETQFLQKDLAHLPILLLPSSVFRGFYKSHIHLTLFFTDTFPKSVFLIASKIALQLQETTKLGSSSKYEVQRNVFTIIDQPFIIFYEFYSVFETRVVMSNIRLKDIIY